ncbi:hypothetical protein KCP91_11625 [Microvirga sp. SRT01]|uniref:Uncharacterized protein n=1 Tax=Sphingomonas longa TaxID=2778730 RepID=A0ABS2D7X7_9SPHN|nr:MULTISPECIES: hypothetical protein [Alphaproteobacteria]MBM6577026.1 hypothetical protein [Sphingomonas sp. BT552]MBR7710070.1 hypothetical protein [Microvirga sp. SRT01]
MATITARSGDVRADRLIAAMAAFQGGGEIGMGVLSAAAPVDHLLAQLAPAV